MKLGIFGGRADSRGLAQQTQGFAKWLHPDKIFGIDMTTDNLSPYLNDWSPYDRWCDSMTILPISMMSEGGVRRWLRGLDVVIGAETFYFPEFPAWAKEEGVRTMLQINPELCTYFTLKGANDPRPDLIVSPSTWLLGKLPGVYHLPFPVDRQQFPFRLRTHAETFVHPMGHGAMADREGTRMVVACLSRLHLRMVIYSQSGMKFGGHMMRYAEVRGAVGDPADLYAEADIIVLPRRYGGQSLKFNEALSSGCPVVCLDRDPERSWGGTVPIASRPGRHINTIGGSIQTHDERARSLLTTLTTLSKRPSWVEELSRQADSYADTISWPTLLPKYQAVIHALGKGEDVEPYLL